MTLDHCKEIKRFTTDEGGSYECCATQLRGCYASSTRKLFYKLNNAVILLYRWNSRPLVLLLWRGKTDCLFQVNTRLFMLNKQIQFLNGTNWIKITSFNSPKRHWNNKKLYVPGTKIKIISTYKINTKPSQILRATIKRCNILQYKQIHCNVASARHANVGVKLAELWNRYFPWGGRCLINVRNLVNKSR